MAMAALTIQDTARRTGLNEATLRYYEEVRLIGPIARDPSNGHRRHREEDVDALQALACRRAVVRRDRRNADVPGQPSAGTRQNARAERSLTESRRASRRRIKTLGIYLDYLRAKAVL